MKKLLVSFSGGATSAYMLKIVKEKFSATHEIVYVFANTGDEREETLQFVDNCASYFDVPIVWVEAVVNQENGVGTSFRIVDYKTASRNGEPFEAVVSKYGIPNVSTPHCTRELKAVPIRKFARSLGWGASDYTTLIGIRADETHRIDWTKAKKERLDYPLAKLGVTKQDVNRFWANMPFRLQLKGYEGNCKVCWKKSLRKLMTIAIDRPQDFDVFKRIETKYHDFVPVSRQKEGKSIRFPIRFFMEHRSCDDIIEEANEFPFERAKDDTTNVITQMSMWDYTLDSNFGCTESCEVF